MSNLAHPGFNTTLFPAIIGREIFSVLPVTLFNDGTGKWYATTVATDAAGLTTGKFVLNSGGRIAIDDAAAIGIAAVVVAAGVFAYGGALGIATASAAGKATASATLGVVNKKHHLASVAQGKATVTAIISSKGKHRTSVTAGGFASVSALIRRK